MHNPSSLMHRESIWSGHVHTHKQTIEQPTDDNNQPTTTNQRQQQTNDNDQLTHGRSQQIHTTTSLNSRKSVNAITLLARFHHAINQLTNNDVHWHRDDNDSDNRTWATKKKPKRSKCRRQQRDHSPKLCHRKLHDFNLGEPSTHGTRQIPKQ